jgi:hypothetical protein
MTTWERIAAAVESKLKSSISYAKITTISSASDYVAEKTAQTLMDKDILILISPPEGESQSSEPMIGGYFRRNFMLEIMVVTKSNPEALKRILGVERKGIFEVQSDIVSALEHVNLAGAADNRAGTNFEGGWSVVPQEGKGITVYSTLYTVTKTEKP